MPSTEYKALLDSAWELHVAKNAGYAGADNADPWANFRMSEAFGVSALDGCLVRMSDKYIRVTNLRKDASNERVGESIRDTLKDLAAYALIAICLLDEEMKPGSAPTDSDEGRAIMAENAAFNAREAVEASARRCVYPMWSGQPCRRHSWDHANQLHEFRATVLPAGRSGFLEDAPERR